MDTLNTQALFIASQAENTRDLEKLFAEAFPKGNLIVSTDLAEAGTLLQTQHYDLLLSNSDTWQKVCSQISALRPVFRSAVILFYDLANEEEALKQLELGVQDCIPLPQLEAPLLQSRACQAIGRQRYRELEIARAQESLNLSESLYQSLVETLPQNIFRKNLVGAFTFANSRFCKLLGKSVAEILGKTDFDFFPHELAAKYQQDDARVVETHTPLELVEKHASPQGTLYVQVIKAPIYDPAKRVTGIQGIFWDVTARYRAEEELAREREFMRAMLDNIPDSIYFKDLHSRFLLCSKALADKMGLRNAADAIGKTELDFFEPASALQALADEQHIIRTGQPIVAKLEREQRRNGAPRWITSTKLPLRNNEGVIIGTFGISRDVTDLKHAEEQLALARDAALESARLKSEFLANMSHEIRTPMNAIIGMSGLLFDTNMDMEQKEYAETIRLSAEALLNIVNDILDFSKIEAGKLAIETIDFELTEVVEGTLELLAEKARAKNLELAGWIAPETCLNLRGDPGRLRQILTNLVDNALKFTEQGEVEVMVAQQEALGNKVRLRFEIRDTGIGIAKDVQSRLFQAFTQADGSLTRRYGGTGLGLAISRQLTELMGGKIGCESELGRGSLFWFTLEFEIQEHPPVRVPAGETNFQGVRVLIVDDNVTNRRILSKQLDAWRLRNDCASNGPEALNLMRKAAEEKDPYGLAVLDMQMPIMDGLTLASSIKGDAQLKNTALIMLTSLGPIPQDRHWRQIGIAEYLIKPVKQSRLLDTIATALGAKAAAKPPPGHFRSATGGSEKVERAKLRILVAEDNIVNQRVALKQLTKLGYHADAVANGLEVLESLERIAYDVILMDCQMPEMDGYEATEQVRHRQTVAGNTNIPYIIAMTANALSGDREECLNAGMDDYICKPVRLEELSAALDRAGRSLKPVQSQSTLPSEPVLDQQTLENLRALRMPDEPDPLRELIELFLQDTPGRLENIQTAFKANNLAELEITAHSLKGSASNLGALKLASLCARIVDYARKADIDSARNLEGKLLESYHELIAFLQKELLK